MRYKLLLLYYLWSEDIVYASELHLVFRCLVIQSQYHDG